VCGQIVGIDDWAFAKRRPPAAGDKRYGAMVVDLEAHRVVGLLPERSAEVVRDWMQAHPDLETVARDRGDSFIAGVTVGGPPAAGGGPAARKVADRLVARMGHGTCTTTSATCSSAWSSGTSASCTP
jgi:transposase